MLECYHLTYSHQSSGFKLSDINFRLNAGDRLGIVGASGAGKSTLLHLLAGKLIPSSGEIFFDGEPLKNPSSDLIGGHEEVKLVYQQFELDHSLTVKQNIAAPLRSYDKAYAKERVELLLEALMLNPIADQKVEKISGGQKQRLAIARALSNEPAVLLLDEPFSNQDAHLKHILLNEVHQLLENSGTVAVFVNHQLSEILPLCNQILCVNQGNPYPIQSPSEFYFHPNDIYSAALCGSVFPWENAFTREEWIQLSDEGSKARVTQQHFLGANYRVFAQLDSGEKLSFLSPEKINHEQIFIQAARKLFFKD
ncbi:MAG: ATP-binding cassette domain-containing protein [Cyclobacteriaceae bacterium]|nr:ATP-binding cassette domain-containing protein [Cyclobacteriaceae bacterium]MCH8514762.1 ATP-binding cassette domain-containing protein [Cyclobacteriaceae bacterium]